MNKQKKLAVSIVKQEYGHKPVDTFYHRSESVSGYFRHHKEQFFIDDITWNDLNMDNVFERMDYTKSSAGAEILYHLLRTSCFEKDELEHRNDIMEAVVRDETLRTYLVYNFIRIGNTGKYSLSDYLDYLQQIKMKSNVLQILIDLLYIPAVALLFVQPEIAVSMLFLLICVNIMSYFKKKGDINPYLVSFGYILRMIKGAKMLTKQDIPVLQKEQQELRELVRELSKFSRFSQIAMSMNQPMGSSNPLDLLMDYMKMLFHVDIMKFYQMLRDVKAHRESIERLFYLTGYLDACCAAAFYRASLKNDSPWGESGYCMPEFSNNMDVKNVYHPLLCKPIANSIEVKKSILLTGSNASGKSTFLKAIGINSILAQSIYTCLATKWEAPMMRTMSSMALKDNIVHGESYFLVEIKALKRILDAAGGADEKILCILDEVLRGTNTLERIAAACQIMRTLHKSNMICFAATHDIELTELLQDMYENYHFEETMENGDIAFYYELKKGPATSRNAIKLLRVLGYQEDITGEAEAMAKRFLESGSWSD